MEKRNTTPSYTDVTPIAMTVSILACTLPAFFPTEDFHTAVWEHPFFLFPICHHRYSTSPQSFCNQKTILTMLLTATYSRQNIGPPKDVYALIPWTCKCVTLCGKRDFAGVIRLRILRWGDYPGLWEWVLNSITSVLIKRSRGIFDTQRRRWCEDRTDREIWRFWPWKSEWHSTCSGMLEAIGSWKRHGTDSPMQPAPTGKVALLATRTVGE